MSKGLVIAGFLAGCLCGITDAAETPGKAELMADVESIQPGTPFMAGVLIRMPEDWHTYWLNSGDSGMPPEMDWKLPAGFAVGPILWPAPKMFDEPPVTSFGYDHEVLLAREIRPPSNLAVGRDYTFEVNATWLVCKEVCIPKTDKLQMTLHARSEPPVAASEWQPLFERAKAEIPAADPLWKFRALAGSDSLSLCVIPPPGAEAAGMAKAAFFPAQPDFVEYGSQLWTQTGVEHCLRMKRVSGDEALPARFEGVLVVPQKNGTKALAVNAALEK